MVDASCLVPCPRGTQCVVTLSREGSHCRWVATRSGVGEDYVTDLLRGGWGGVFRKPHCSLSLTSITSPVAVRRPPRSTFTCPKLTLLPDSFTYTKRREGFKVVSL